jgi:hypothetical protein
MSDIENKARLCQGLKGLISCREVGGVDSAGFACDAQNPFSKCFCCATHSLGSSKPKWFLGTHVFAGSFTDLVVLQRMCQGCLSRLGDIQ